MRTIPLGLFVVACVIAMPPSGLAQAHDAGAGASAPKNPGTGKGTGKTTVRSVGFDDVAKEADAARLANQLADAIPLYEKALKLNPRWAEGWWFLGTSNYELDRYQPARDAFRRTLDLGPNNGSAWTFKGLCEFQLKNFDTALRDLMRGRSLGVPNKDLVSVARYHIAILLTRNGEFEQAAQLMNEFAFEGNDSPRVIEALGVATLRMPILPADLPGAKRDIVMLAGRAGYLSSARLLPAAEKAFEELVARYPETPNVHYAYGVFLTGEQPDRAIEEFKQELKISPSHPWSALQIAFEYIKRGDWEAARPWAQQAATEAPDNFVAHRAMGQVLLETGDTEGAIRELEMGVQLAPDSPAMRFALARAYRRAGRVADADREQAKFTELDRILRTQRAGAQSVGGIEMDSAATPRKDVTPQ